MSDSRLEIQMEEIGATGGNPVEVIDQDVFDLSLKSKEFGDVVPSDPVEHLEKRDVAISSVNNGSGNNSNKSSKRQRKNRRRRRKNAHTQPVEEANVTYQSSDAKEDTETDGDTFIEKESEENDQASAISTKSSLVMTTVEEITESTTTVCDNSSCTNLHQLQQSGPTCSVQSLLNFAKERITEGKEVRKSPREDLEDLEFNMVVPPCSPSSVHNITAIDCDDPAIAKTKLSPLLVNFDNRSHEEVSLEPVLSDVTAQSVVSTSKFQEDRSTQFTLSSGCSSIEAITLGTLETSSVISLASLQSTASLLKGGNSCDDVEVFTYHFPSADDIMVQGGAKECISKSHPSLSTECFRETIEVFKLQNPQETNYLEQQVNSILSKSVNKYSSLVGDSDILVLRSQMNETKRDVSAESEILSTLSSDKQSQTEVMKKMNDTNFVTNVDIEIKPFVYSVNCNAMGSEERVESTSTIQIETISLQPSIGNFTEEEKHDAGDNLNSTYVVDYAQPDEVEKPPLVITDSLLIMETSSVHSEISNTTSVPTSDVNQNASQAEKDESCQYDFETLSEVQITVNEVVDAVELECLSDTSGLIPNLQNASTQLEKTSVSGDTRMAAHVRQSVEMFSINLPTTSNQPKGSGDQPFSAQYVPINAIKMANLNRWEESDIESEGECQRPVHGDGNGTDSDFPWLPERRNMLAKVIGQKEARPISAGRLGANATIADVNDGGEDTGCKCAKMCVIC